MGEWITQWISNDMGFEQHYLIARSPSSKARPGCSALVRFCVHLLFLLAALTVARTTTAQTPLNDLIFTVGTTVRDQSSQDWSYVLVGAVDPALLRGKRFAVFAKAGDPSSVVPFN